MGGVFGGGKKTVIDNGSIGGFQVNQSAYGIVVPVILGTSRQAGNIIDYFGFTAIPHETTQQTGKGGGSSTTTIDYTYRAAVLLALCEGQIAGVGKVWIDTDTVTTLAGAGLTLFPGAVGQAPWSYSVSVQPTKALPYSGLAYVAGYIDLNSQGGVQQYNFEVKGALLTTGDGIDVNPDDAIKYIVADLGLSIANIDAGSSARFSDFCMASDMLVTIPLVEQDAAYKTTNTLCEMTNTIVFWSQSKIKFVPRCEEQITGNGLTYTPNTTPEYDLDEDDFLDTGDGQLVKWERTDNAETYNQATVEFTNRENNYEKETVEYQIAADINKRGLRPMPTVSYPWIHTKARAEYVAQRMAMDSCYSRNTYKFRLGLAHSLLEPGDIVTLTESAAGLNLLPVMLEAVKENGKESYDCEAKYRPLGTYSPARYTTYESERAAVDRYADPGDVAAPVIFEPIKELTNGNHETWIAAGGTGPNWGGCGVWISDDDEKYRRIGAINNPCRYGVLSALLAADGATLSVDMVATSNNQLLSGTAADAAALNTLCYVGGEYVAYETATLTAANNYDLSGLVRGAYNSAVSAHDAGTVFVRLDSALFKHPTAAEDIGKTIYVKFTSYNIYGVAEQSLADVDPYVHIVTDGGRPPVDIDYFAASVSNGKVLLTWRRTGGMPPTAEGYEIRKGATWGASQLVVRAAGRDTDSIEIAAFLGTTKYWIVPYNSSGYAPNPLSDEITIDKLPQKETILPYPDYDETATITENGVRIGESIVQKSTVLYGDIKAKTYSEIAGMDLIGGGNGVAVFTGVKIDLGKVAKVIISPFEVWARVPDQPVIYEIQTSTDDATYSDWKLLTAGQVTTRYLYLRGSIQGVSSPGVLQELSLQISAEQQTLFLRDIAIAVGGTYVPFDPPFVNTPAIAVSPNGVSGVTVKKTDPSGDGVTIQLFAGETDVGGAADVIPGGF